MRSPFLYVCFLPCIFLTQCGGGYKESDLIGVWQIIEIKSEKNTVPVTFLGQKTVAFTTDGKYNFPGSIIEPGEWTVKDDKLRLHTNSVKDMTGSVVYDGHDSEWIIDKSTQYMIWRGTRRFHNDDLEVIFERLE